MKAFLIEYDRVTERVHTTTFEDRAEALRALREREAARPEQLEVVLLFAESEDDLRTTHARYFRSARDLAAHPLG